MQDTDPYAVLGVARGASERELRRAYHSLSLKWHPDHHMQAGSAAIALAEVEFKRINHAYVLACQALQIKTTPTPAQVRQRTRQEIQLDTVARSVTSARLMMIAQYWGLNPYTYRREVEVARQILADVVVFGARAFPGGFARALPVILVEQSLATEEGHMRELLTEAMQVIIDRADDDEVEEWERIFAPLGYRPARTAAKPAPTKAAPRPAREAPPRDAAPLALPEAASSVDRTPPRTRAGRTDTGWITGGAPERPATPWPAAPGTRTVGRTRTAVGVAVIGVVAAVAGALLAPGLVPSWAFVALAAGAVLMALALYFVP